MSKGFPDKIPSTIKKRSYKVIKILSINHLVMSENVLFIDKMGIITLNVNHDCLVIFHTGLHSFYVLFYFNRWICSILVHDQPRNISKC